MDRIQTPGKQDPGRQEPLELPGRNSSTYGDGDIPEIDLPGADAPPMIVLRNFLKTACSPDESGLHFSAHFSPLPSRAGACNRHSTKQHNARRTADTARSGHCAGMCSVSGTVLTDCPHCINGGGGI
ncbi:MAG: hypothetical protein ACLUKO_19000 [Enterocloster bolteae]